MSFYIIVGFILTTFIVTVRKKKDHFIPRFFYFIKNCLHIPESMIGNFSLHVISEVKIKLCEFCFFSIVALIFLNKSSHAVSIIYFMIRVQKITCLHNVFQTKASFGIGKWVPAICIIRPDTTKRNGLSLAGI